MSSPASFTPSALLSVYRKALLIHVVDERVRTLLRSGRMAAVYYSPRGQEILAAAMGVHLAPTDYLVCTYRGIHNQLAKGLPLKQLMAEYYGKATGTCKGKGGPMHITHPETGVMVTTGVVGSGLPIANGLGWASQLREDGRVTVCSFGDGASNIGAFHEALNMAALWKLPVIFLCENNLYGECTSYEKATASATIADRAIAYGSGMRGVTVNGNDAEAMWRAAGEAVARARAGEGPTLLEARTFRFMGHYFGDPGAYIPKDEYAAALAKDPMPATRERVLQSGAATQSELDALTAEYNALVDEALQFAADSPFPDVSEIDKDIYGAAA
ncbi:pyruvate dehydrogenase E1 component alpha subunit [Solimonas aquatica]|uniref:Pyruvate dehydrogenase E1 component alpha subunit n=1 Tax=Solimonas aquatica TaxID=489703 RepID=A0A1H9LCH8_9GAMM|nr:thiamine pyrophosphate-dependent dehydrogenase E1 component subunit alpha [Solimonas aquatica]SER08673.1 pyruvate dehydrogenase E1 component alpha subunit [Solimonas aquatica]